MPGEGFRFPIDFRQTNHEGELVEWVHMGVDTASEIIINPAAWSFTSIAFLDALKMFPDPIIKVHISNIHKREALFHPSYVSLVATAVIAGLGADGYDVAVTSISKLHKS